jgi:hypothetical protein
VLLSFRSKVYWLVVKNVRYVVFVIVTLFFSRQAVFSYCPYQKLLCHLITFPFLKATRSKCHDISQIESSDNWSYQITEQSKQTRINATTTAKPNTLTAAPVLQTDSFLDSTCGTNISRISILNADQTYVHIINRVLPKPETSQ